jgi:hypothetical protein
MPSIYKSKTNKNSEDAKKAKKDEKYSLDGKLYNTLAEYNIAKAAKAAAKAGNAKGVARVAKEKAAAETKKIAREQGVKPSEVPGLQKKWAIQKKRMPITN